MFGNRISHHFSLRIVVLFAFPAVLLGLGSGCSAQIEGLDLGPDAPDMTSASSYNCCVNEFCSDPMAQCLNPNNQSSGFCTARCNTANGGTDCPTDIFGNPGVCDPSSGYCYAACDSNGLCHGGMMSCTTGAVKFCPPEC